jgi:hypothetical protein
MLQNFLAKKQTIVFEPGNLFNAGLILEDKDRSLPALRFEMGYMIK